MDGVEQKQDKLESEVTKMSSNDRILKIVYREYQARKHTAFRNPCITIGDVMSGAYRYEDDVKLVEVFGRQLNYFLDKEMER